MSVDTRANILVALEGELEAKVLAYVTGDRPRMETQISPDQPFRFRRHLRALGHQPHVALLLYTRGGDTNTACRWST